MTKKVETPQVTKPISSLCNGQVSRAARTAMEANMVRIKIAMVKAAEKK